MRIALLLFAACTSNNASDRVGSGSVTIDGAPAAMAAWMTPATFYDDTQPDLPTKYIGWSVTLAQVPPGTSCDDPAVRYPSWTADVTVYSQTTGSLPEDAPITPGTFDVRTPAAPPSAGIQVELGHATGLASAGTLTITAFDERHTAGSFAVTGATTDVSPTPFSSNGEFSALRCD